MAEAIYTELSNGAEIASTELHVLEISSNRDFSARDLVDISIGDLVRGMICGREFPLLDKGEIKCTLRHYLKIGKQAEGFDDKCLTRFVLDVDDVTNIDVSGDVYSTVIRVLKDQTSRGDNSGCGLQLQCPGLVARFVCGLTPSKFKVEEKSLVLRKLDATYFTDLLAVDLRVGAEPPSKIEWHTNLLAVPPEVEDFVQQSLRQAIKKELKPPPLLRPRPSPSATSVPIEKTSSEVQEVFCLVCGLKLNSAYQFGGDENSHVAGKFHVKQEKKLNEQIRQLTVVEDKLPPFFINLEGRIIQVSDG